MDELVWVLLYESIAKSSWEAYSEGTSTPGATTVNLLEVGKHREGGLVTERHVDEAVVSESAHGGNDGGLLATTEGAGGDEDTGILSPVTTGGPDGAGLVPKGLPLSREVTVARRDTEQDGIVLQKVLRLGNWVVRLGRGVHLGQDLLRECLGDPT